jgi:hypothetical protein
MRSYLQSPTKPQKRASHRSRPLVTGPSSLFPRRSSVFCPPSSGPVLSLVEGYPSREPLQAPAVYQEKCQAKACPARPITTLYYTFNPVVNIKKWPFRRKFDPKTKPHNAPKIAILLIQKDLTPSGAPENHTGTLESFAEKSTGTLENFPQNPAGAPENPCPTPESFPESPTEAPETPCSRPRNPHLSRKGRRKKNSLLSFSRENENKGQRPRSYEEIPPLLSTHSLCRLSSVVRPPAHCPSCPSYHPPLPPDR